MPARSKVRRSANLTINTGLLEEARGLQVNLSRPAERGIEAAVKAERERRWKEENREAIESSNRWVEVHGLPLAKYRQF
ncbi:MAG: type II toxin-antitoxin system CcdA family antitoxin [Rhizobiaceae bacterium]